MKNKKRLCIECGDEFEEGRADKKFCRDICRMAYNHERRKESTPEIFYAIRGQLNLNRKILKRFNPGAKVTVRKERLFEAGFNEKCFTHVWKNGKGKAFWFVFEYGFTRVEGSQDHFLLVTWQKYMNRQLKLKNFPTKAIK